MNKNLIFMIILVIALFMSKSPEVTQETPTGASINPNTIDSSVSFTGRDKYVGTLLTSDYIRVIRYNGGFKDLGYYSLNNGALSTTPNEKYKFYFFMNTSPSASYYVDVQDYTAPLQDAVDPQIGEGCAIDTSPTFYVTNSAGGLQSATANAESITNGQTVTVRATIKAHSDHCYGTPKVNGKNSVCFIYNSTVFNIDSTAEFINTPYPITKVQQNTTNSTSISCYGFKQLAPLESVEIPVILKANAEPTSSHNIAVVSDDIGVDVNLKTSSEIIGYADENNNNLGAAPLYLGAIYVS